MNNKKMLENILKIREIRTNLKNLNISDLEKEVLRRSLNFFEDELNLDIIRNNLNKEEYDSENIPNDIEIINVPVEENTNRYNEYANVLDNYIISIINDITNSIDNLNLDNNEIIIILKSLKEYSDYLKNLILVKNNNKNIYNEVINDNIKK